MSPSRHASKFMKTISKFQKISLQNKSAYEGSDTKTFSWLPFGWSRAIHQENFDGLNDNFNSTGIVADSIFMYANPEAAPLQQEKILLSSKSKCPAQRMLDQQTTHSHPKLKDLYRRRCGLPIDANEVKDPLTDEQKKFIEKLKRCPNNPPTLDKFQGVVQQGYSHVKTNVSLPGKAELVSELPYWVKTADTSLVGAIDLRSPAAYLANESVVATEKNALVEDSALNLSGLPQCWASAEKSENVTATLAEDDFELDTAHTYAGLVDNGVQSCQIDNTPSLPTQNVFSQPSNVVTTNKLIRFFSSTSKKSKGEKKKCQKVPSSVPSTSSQGKCAKAQAAGCGSRARENCNPVVKKRDTCEKMGAPSASYSECLKEPTPSSKMSECARKDNGLPEQCRTPNEGLSIDGCDPPGPKSLGACTKSKQASPRSNVCIENKGGCDPSIKPFKNAAFSAPSSISCPSPHMTSRVSELRPLSFPFSTPKRCFSSEGSSSKPRKSKKGHGEPVDWLKSKSPNECKKKRGKCDPRIKPFKNSSPPLVRTQFYATPIIIRVSNARDLVSPQNPPQRYFSTAMKATKNSKPKKPCFEPKKVKKLTELDTHSRVACENLMTSNRCDKAKCNPSSIDCKKPAPIHQYRCPEKPLPGKRRKKVRVIRRKMLLGYKVCDKPPRIRPFQCKPKVARPVIPKPAAPTRCPCFSPMVFDRGSTCRKMPNAVEPNCKKPRSPDAEPTGKCDKC